MAKRKRKSSVLNKQRQLTPVITVAIALIVLFCAILGAFEMGLIGEMIAAFTKIIFGQYPIIIFAWLILQSFAWIFFRKKTLLSGWQKAGLMLLVSSICVLFVFINHPTLKGFAYFNNYVAILKGVFNSTQPALGGLVGAFFYSLYTVLFDQVGALIFTVLLLFFAILMLFYPTANRLQENFWERNQKLSISKLPFKLPKRTPKPKLVQTTDFTEPEKEKEIPEVKSNGYKSIFIDVDPPKPNKVVVPKIDIASKVVAKPAELKTTVINDSEEVLPTAFLKPYQFPPLSLLDQPKASSNQKSNANSAQVKGERLLNILNQFGISASLVQIHIGPAVTKFELKLESGVKVSKISSLQDNIMMELAVKEIRIEAPIPGRNAIGVEVPNQEMTPVRLIELFKEIPSNYINEPLLVGLGKNLMGKNIYGLINKMPHLLVAGATGSGKSVGINVMICSLLLHSKPSDVKLILIDPKKVEFQVYKGIPHLVTDVVTEPVKAAKILLKVVEEMDSRYRKFTEVNAKSLSTYNEQIKNYDGYQPMPHLVVIIDELADLMMVAGKEVESSIQRITQLARAAGIHLIVATQRPSVDVVTGVIKANIPSRIAFAVSSATDSRTILDSVGAERLLGYGDMLYQPFGEPHATRIQGAYISDAEVSRIADFAKKQGPPVYMDHFMVNDLEADGGTGNGFTANPSEDPLFDEVKEYVIAQQKASTSLLQRRFGIGYNRAARIIDILEEHGVIGPAQGSKPRDVYIKPENMTLDLDDESVNES